MIWKIWLFCSLFNILGFSGVFVFIKDRISYALHPEKWKKKPEFLNPFKEDPMGCATELMVILAIVGPIGTLWLISIWYADWRDTKKLIKEILEEEKRKEKEDLDKYDMGLH